MPAVVVDSSVWIDFFRHRQSKVAPVIRNLVEENQARLTPIIRVELLSGARNEPEYRNLEELLVAVLTLEEPPDFWNRVARARFRLARAGLQASVPDVSIAVLAQCHGCSLFTLDRQFLLIAQNLGLKLFSSD
jgi:predicted nucleic acid-binding protein